MILAQIKLKVQAGPL